MDYSINLIDTLYKLFKNNNELLTILGIQDNKDVKTINARIRRQLETQELLDSTDNTFFVYTFIPSVMVTDNYMVNKGVLEFRLYSPQRGILNKLFMTLRHILNDNYEGMQIISEGSFATGTKNLIGYMFRVKPLTWS